LLGAFPDFHAEILEVRDLGEFMVVVLRVRGRGAESDTPRESEALDAGAVGVGEAGSASDLATFAPHRRSSEWGPETQGTRPIGVFGKPVPDFGYPGVLTGSRHCSTGGFQVACRWGQRLIA